MENQETKRIIKNPSRSTISLKNIPPLDPSSIPFYPSYLKPRRMMEPVTVAKQKGEKSDLNQLLKKVSEVKEDNATSSFSNIQIDPNSTRSVTNIITPEKKLVPEPEEDTKPMSKGTVYIAASLESKHGSAKSVLHERCVAKRWKPPVYECCKVEGPCHLRLFTFKVVVEIRDSSGKTFLECFGDPKHKKKAAAEHAAEAALWYLEHLKQKLTKLHL